jgi:Reverse transcriptase (RNA-dependent DNA polymerase)
VFLAELNKLELWATDIGNAYLEATASEKVCIIAGREFGDLKGHVLVINKALYGLRTSGKRWHEQLANCLRDLGFQPCVAEPDIWLRVNHNIYKYIGVYVNDLAIVAKDPQSITDKLSNQYKFKLKGTGPMTFHLGCDYTRDEHGMLCIYPQGD